MSDNFRVWIETLQTTDLPQAQKQLTDGEGFCCLGIACKVAPEDIGSAYIAEPGAGELLPMEVAEWLGLKSLWPEDSNYTWEMAVEDAIQVDLEIDYPQGAFPARGIPDHTAANYNDEGLTFPQIADMIRYFGISRLQA